MTTSRRPLSATARLHAFLALLVMAAMAPACSDCSGKGSPPTTAPGAQAPAPAPAPQPQATAAHVQAAEDSGEPDKVIIIFIEADEEVGPAPLRVKFTVYDPYQRLERPEYRWDFGDGSPGSTERSPIHVYEKPGDYEAKLVVTDDGATDEDSTEIQVEEPE